MEPQEQIDRTVDSVRMRLWDISRAHFSEWGYDDPHDLYISLLDGVRIELCKVSMSAQDLRRK